MATSGISDTDNRHPMHHSRRMLVEDEFGYVDPVGHSRKISMDIMMQLPSNQIEDGQSEEVPESSTTRRRRSLKRSETRYKTMKMKRVAFNSSSLDDDVERVYEILTSDPDVEQDEIKSNLRDLYQSLTVKRMVKAKIDSEQETRHRLESLNCCARLQYRIAMLWVMFKNSLEDISYSLELWHSSVKKVQGHSGSGVASYFIFLRWLLYLNLFNFIIASGFIFTPQMIHESSNGFVDLMENNVSFSGFDLLTGSGWLGNSSFFYGRYTNETIEVATGYRYSMPLAYLFTIGVAAVINLIVVAYSVTKAYQTKYVHSSGEVNQFCGKIFCAWDFSIEKPDTARLRHRLLYFELKESLSGELETDAQPTFCSQLTKLSVCLAVNCFVVFSILGIGYLVYLILEYKALEVEIRILKLMTLALTVTAISFVFHYVISYATKLEYFFSTHVQLYLLLGRVAALRIVILSVLMYFWLVVYIPGPGDTRCYESLLGEEVYRLIVVNFLMNVIICTCCGEFLRKVLSKYLCCTKGLVSLAKFDVAYNTNDLIYYQTLVWIGAFYSPMLPLLFLVILILLFYMKLHSVTTNCQPSQKPWSSADAQTVFLVLALMNFLLTAVGVGYTIFRIKPSSTCGPFQTHDTMYGIIADTLNLSDDQNTKFSKVLQYAGSPALLFTVILTLGVAVYYARAHAVAHQNIVKRVQQQLIVESKDKVFLLHLFESAYREHMNGMKSTEADRGDGCERSTIHENSCDSPREVRNPVYRDYYTGQTSNGQLSPAAISPHARYDPGYLKADVPANDQCRKPDTTPPGGDLRSPVFDFDLQRRLSPTRDLDRCASPDSPASGKRRGELLPRPVHKQGFQYLVRGEPPPRVTGGSRHHSNR